MRCSLGQRVKHFAAFDLVIFERSSGGMRETPAGRHFLHMAPSLEQMETLVIATQANGRGKTGRLVIGCCSSLTTGNSRASPSG
jgi:DNA-binding transcriptional LysR family regulator